VGLLGNGANRGSAPTERAQIGGRMRDFSAQAKRLSSEVHRLSHELHPAKLQQLGLVAAVRGFCNEFSAGHQIAIEFADGSVPRTFPADTALCLYRIAQESLHNVVPSPRHAHAILATRGRPFQGQRLGMIGDGGVTHTLPFGL
jgi:signal transduction histidine kinase